MEVSHEALIREWPRLADWLREGREDIRLLQALSEDSVEWEQRGKPRDRLYRGSQLKDARIWARRNLPSTREIVFLHASATQRMRSVLSMIVVVLLLLSSTGIAGWFFLHQSPDPTHVTNLLDDGVGSLRWAIANAPPGSTITFDASLKGTIMFPKLQDINLPIGRNLTIRGPVAGVLAISGGKLVFEVSKGVSATIANLTIKNSGEGILNEGTLTLLNSTVSHNTADNTTGSNGGGIENGGALTLLNSTVSDNSASTEGGGILVQGLIDNNGRSSVQADLTFSTVYGNRAAVGADIAVKDGSYLIISRGLPPKVVFKPSKQFSQVKLRNSIVAGDPAHPSSDIVGMLTSYGYNLFQDNSGATFDAATSKLNGTDQTVSVNDLPGLFASPVGLRNNGGPTRTYALGPNSPAVDQIPLQYCQVKDIFDSQSRIYTDQRGMKRPDKNESACDIGAYEYVDAPT